MPAVENQRLKATRLVVLTLVLVQSIAVVVLAYARFGDPRMMPEQVLRLAIKVGNAQLWRIQIPPDWARLCVAWDTWLGEIQDQGPRWLRTEGLMQPADPLRAAISDFLATAKDLHPASLVPAAAAEKRLAVLAREPPDDVLRELQLPPVFSRISEASLRITRLAMGLESWSSWERMRRLLTLMENRGFTRAAAEMKHRLPPTYGTPEYRLDVTRTLKLFNELSLDPGALRLLSRWTEYSRLSAHLQAGKDLGQQAEPGRLPDRLTDRPTLGEFADSLDHLLEELRQPRLPAAASLDSPAMEKYEPARELRPLVPVRPP